jgi:hypothetical protein
MSEADEQLSRDLLRGADELALFLYGDASFRRKVYHLAATSNLPIFKLGAMICARKSVLLAWIEDQERRHANDNGTTIGKYVKIGKV